MEVWKPVSLALFSCHYEVSSLGRLRRISPSKRDKNPHLLKCETTRKGYIRVRLIVPGASIRILVHVLVAETFLGKAGADYQVNHKDGVKANNRTDNLEWVTGAQNVQHSFRNGFQCNPKGEDHPCAKLTDRQVEAIREARICGAKLQEIATEYGVSKSHVHGLTTGKSRWAV